MIERGWWRKARRIWPASALRLAWGAAREDWPTLWVLPAIGVGLPAAWSWSLSSKEPTPWILGALAVGLIAGVNVFNAENRRGTRRFLAHHGARPGVVWLAKVAVGLAAVAPIWLISIGLSSSLWSGSEWRRPPALWDAANLAGFRFAAVLIGNVLAGAFAAGAWCGMVFRRGSAAGHGALILWLAICPPLLLMVRVGMIWPLHLPWASGALLAVTWAWSADWLLDEPGVGRWARLALLSIAMTAGLGSAYLAERVWSAPTIAPAERERIFQFARIAAPIPSGENAADIYRAVDAGNLDYPPIPVASPDFGTNADWNQDAKEPKALAWLNRDEPHLEALRKAAAMPICRFEDLRRTTAFSMRTAEVGLVRFHQALLASSRIKLARGDPAGAWSDIEALLRMSRQFCGLNPHHIRRLGKLFENQALPSAMRWATDPRQTAETLEAARASLRALSRSPSFADRLRADALIVHNTMEMPREELVRELRARGSEDSWINGPMIDLVTTPWELARFRRVYGLVAAARIQLAEQQPGRVDFPPGLEGFPDRMVVGEGPRVAVVSAADLRGLISTTPLMSIRGLDDSSAFATPSSLDDALHRRALDLILGLRLWQLQHGGRLPRSLNELAEADPEIRPSLIDPHASPPAWFGYVVSRGQKLRPLGLFDRVRVDWAAATFRLDPTDDFMLLYSVGPDGKDDRAAFNLNTIGKGDIIFPIKDNVPPPARYRDEPVSPP